MPYQIDGKCIYHKHLDGTRGDKVGCTKGDVHNYMAALQANSGEHSEGRIKELKEFLNHVKKRVVRETYEGADKSNFWKRHKNIQRNEAGSFFVVTNPNIHSTIDDILFLSDPVHFANQIRGGLKEEEIYGFYKSKSKAIKTAQKLLKVRDAQSMEQHGVNTAKINQLEQEIAGLKDSMQMHLDKASDEPGTADSNHADASSILDQIKEKESQLKDLQP